MQLLKARGGSRSMTLSDIALISAVIARLDHSSKPVCYIICGAGLTKARTRILYYRSAKDRAQRTQQRRCVMRLPAETNTARGADRGSDRGRMKDIITIAGSPSRTAKSALVLRAARAGDGSEGVERRYHYCDSRFAGGRPAVSRIWIARRYRPRMPCWIRRRR